MASCLRREERGKGGRVVGLICHLNREGDKERKKGGGRSERSDDLVRIKMNISQRREEKYIYFLPFLSAFFDRGEKKRKKEIEPSPIQVHLSQPRSLLLPQSCGVGGGGKEKKEKKE